MADGSYGYVSTSAFPYVVGCWGPAATGCMNKPTCSSYGCASSTYSYSGQMATKVGGIALEMAIAVWAGAMIILG